MLGHVFRDEKEREGEFNYYGRNQSLHYPQYKYLGGWNPTMYSRSDKPDLSTFELKLFYYSATDRIC